ncbi:hypothetical protein CONPUDRAFT_68331 [Coniophora puteana RWD-64-598 SS2]|uniref:Reverse transcriptase zinc-binding domain-containing protein n=1 Tax=Coniophora puteana (strain RWD-64-598) TaxID=741705 RepID=R7SD93_CONPW|nr:uncharacterized protein CONPUDRAFT_68331 [Coniophora puteana RWD-64-598 SS2]EIW73830.1 hypothetical protein CONPUDRAFT_68331 [Coniophora puteana RWD-64-598 SS2]
MIQISGLPRRQGSLLTQLRMRHIALNAFLHRIKVVEDPRCDHCARGVHESIRHFLFECPAWGRARQEVVRALGRRAESLAYLLNDEKGVKALMCFMNSTGRFRKTYGDIARRKCTA